MEMKARHIYRIIAAIVLCLVILPVLQVLLVKFVDPPFTVSMVWRWVIHTVTLKPCDIAYEWRPLSQISPYLRRAVLAAEDQRFVSHGGFDFIELEKALKEMENGDRMRGASTISMQAARTLFLWSGRSWVRKGLEAYYTVLLELILSKERILELYLNTVDWGAGVYGAEAAANKYFRTSSSRLSRAQAALLAAILPNPKKWSATKPGPYVRKRQQFILRYMNHMPLLAE
jgi:monofunctional biosynthetic peptidoglycan transglycosylase